MELPRQEPRSQLVTAARAEQLRVPISAGLGPFAALSAHFVFLLSS